LVLLPHFELAPSTGCPLQGGFALCPLAPEDIDEPFVTLAGDNGSGVVKAFANDELAAFSAGVRTPTATPHQRTMSCAFQFVSHA